MIPITILNFIIVGLLYLSYRLKLKNSLMPACILILIMFFSFRYNYGNDYRAYEKMFNVVRVMSLDASFHRYERMERGWIVLNYIFRDFDFQYLIVLLTVIQFGTIGWFISKYVDVKWQWAVMAIYLFQPSYMLIQLSMLRQGLASQLVMMSIYFLTDKRKYWWVGALIILLAVQFHKSAYMGFLILLLPLLSKLDYKILIFLYVIIFTVFQFMWDISMSLMNSVLAIDEFERYDVYLGSANVVQEQRTGLGFTFQLLLGLYMLFMLRWKSTKNRIFVLSMSIYYATIPLTGLVGLTSRIVYYFYTVGLLGYSEVMKRAERDPIALLLMMVLIFYIGQAYFSFFYDHIWTEKYLHYTTIFDH